jgi:hypothetical protein
VERLEEYKKMSREEKEALKTKGDDIDNVNPMLFEKDEYKEET